jgi:hypothetical protein
MFSVAQATPRGEILKKHYEIEIKQSVPDKYCFKAVTIGYYLFILLPGEAYPTSKKIPDGVAPCCSTFSLPARHLHPRRFAYHKLRET